MAIRLRTVDGIRIALCATETDQKIGDVYLDDADHYALAAKFAQDYRGETISTVYDREWNVMLTQKIRDAKEELMQWINYKALGPKEKRKMNIMHNLQNSILTRWIWRYWQHDETGRICILPFWKSPGRRWYIFKGRQ